MAQKLVAVTESEGRFDGPAFGTPEGLLASHSDYDATFRTYLHRVQDNTKLIEKAHMILMLCMVLIEHLAKLHSLVPSELVLMMEI